MNLGGQKMTKRKGYRAGHVEQNKQADLVDIIMEFENFRERILPAIRRDVASGLKADELRLKYQALLAAEQITIALTDEDASKRLSAIKDITDRSEGKPKETKEIHHKLEKLEEDQLDSLLLSELEDLENLEKRKH
jgi:hypothetical protein